MATVDLTLDQILDAVRQLPAEQRQRLRQEIDRLPATEQVLRIAARTRDRFRMGGEGGKRMSELLEKGNSGELSVRESRELDGLVREFEQRTEAMAKSLAGTAASRSPKKSTKRRRSS